ncbi:MAG TPA: S8 family serine peptidase, partial [Isosphaeraceae bacterium]|nr:S8 family serine peptidase [Isosphaeraceae bacterium]
MGSFMAKGRNQGPNRRRGTRHTMKRPGFPKVEILEDRLVLSGSDATLPTPLWHPTSTNLFDAQNGPMANLGVGTVQIYQAFVQSQGNAAALAAEFPSVEFSNGLVGLQVKSLGGDFTQFVTSLQNVGMQLTADSSLYGLVDGYAPVNALPTIAEMAQTESGQLIYKPSVDASNYQGEAYNEAETSMFADVARSEFGVDGTGVTVGVLSDSVSQYAGGLANSYSTGDLNPNTPVNVIQDGAAGGTDEGRAMLENVHDVAPGASLAFATAEGGDLAFANNIQKLATTGKANLIADDIGYADEPFFQDGVISQAINTVTASGITYFSAAGNTADQGYLSTFRGVQGTISGIGSGTFMSFNPVAGSSTSDIELPVTTDGANAEIIFEYDQPFQTQEPAGAAGKVTSNVNIYVINAATGAVVVGAGANNNNVAIQEPWQFITIPSAGSYYIAVQVVSGSNPGHIEFVNFNENVNLIVNQQYGSAGGTYYPTSYGHATDVNTIGVGATPWWAPAPYLGQTPLFNEPFSSHGPSIYDLTVDGTPMSPVLAQNPTITAPDGGNTSFFPPGGVITTNNPPFQGEPATTTNLSQNLPSFFGTSSATPNAEAVAALMLQKVPGLTPAEIRQGLIAGALPMNNTPAGTWNPQSGFGLVNAIRSINAVDVLRVVSTNPAANSTVTSAPGAITVTFNKPVNFATVSASDLVFTGAPAGVSVVVGTPVAVDNPTEPTIIQFPISFSKPVGTLANGTYSFEVTGPVISEDDKALATYGPVSFTLADTTAPRIVNTSESGRTVTITFDKALDPATVTLSNIYVMRGNGNPNFTNSIDLNNDPRATISYNPQTFTVTLNYSGLPQTEMPSDYYAIVVLSKLGASPGVTDLVGNSLNGQFTGSFPSGTTPQGAVSFVQVLGLLGLSAPQITTFVMSPSSDTGIANDQNSMLSQPQFVGQVFAPFPATVANDPVYLEFSGLHGGITSLAPGGGGRGFTGTYDEEVATDANGVFTVTPPAALTEGFQYAAAVVVGQPDQPPLPGYASLDEDAFRIDKTPPQITGASLTPGGAPLPLPNGGQPNVTNVPGLSTLTLNVQDPVNPGNSPFETPAAVLFQAINPATAINISNYSLINTTTHVDESSFILTATFVAGTPVTATDVNGNSYIVAYTGQINLTFASGLPSGSYQFIAHTNELQYPGLADAAGNYLDDTNVPGEGTKDFTLNLAISNTPVYITNLQLESDYTASGSSTIGGPRSYFELPGPGGVNTRDNVPAPPNTFVISLSNPIPYANYSNDVQLIRSADSVTSPPDGDFGNLGEGGLGSTGTGFTIVGGTTVTLYNDVYNPQTNSYTSTPVGPGGTGNQLVLSVNGTLTPDYYRIYIPNQLEPGGIDTRIYDIYGNQLDGEFLGDQTANGTYEDLMPNGQYRQGLSGDGVAGGAFMTAFEVVPYGNVVYARPDYQENSLLPSTLSDGSLAKPYPVLAPEGDPNSPLANNPTHNPNLGLNNPGFFLSGFNPEYDRSGDGQFEQSALYAASQLAYGGPVVVVALPGTPSRNPLTGAITEASFVLQAPAGSNAIINDGSTSVPFDTTLVFTAGSTLKLLNAALFVQNQGSALEANGTPTNPVTFTSYNDASIGGATNGNPDTTPRGGDWGGIIFRNYDEAITAQQVSFPAEGSSTSGVGPGSGVLVGPNGGPAVSGAQDAMSVINFADINYAGGAVPQGSSTFYSGITLYNSRPAITNTQISHAGGTGGTEAAIGEDFDSLREDDTARGPLIRRVTVTANVLNGIWLMSETNGLIEPTSAMPYPTNPSTLGGSLNYALANPLPYLVLAQIVVGETEIEGSGGNQTLVGDRLYVQPGMMVKFDEGAGLDVINPAASLNVGSRSYITGYDQNNSYSPESPNFVQETTADAEVLFTSLHDDTATTFYVDPTTGQQTIIVPAINATGETTTPALGPAMWGSVGINGGAIVVINHAMFRYGGGLLHTPSFSVPSQSVLAFLSGLNTFTGFGTTNPDGGTHAYITNNDFIDNFDAAMQIDPNGLLAGDPLRPLLSGHPFFRNNVLQGNGIDGLAVVTARSYLTTTVGGQYIGPVEAIGLAGYINQTVSTVWDATDLTYVLRGTIVMGGAYSFFGTTSSPPVPNLTAYGAEPTPYISTTIQSALPGTLLADGSTIPSPGQSVVVKLLSDYNPVGDGSLAQFGSSGSNGGNSASTNGGAGWVVGVDDGVDPPSSPLVDPGAYDVLRILGIPGDQTTGQQQVPVYITSLRDDTVGVTARGVQEYDIFNS